LEQKKTTTTTTHTHIKNQHPTPKTKQKQIKTNKNTQKQVIDYTTQDVAEVYGEDDAKKLDIVLDCMGTRSELLQKLLATLKPGGHLSHILSAGTDNAILDAAKAKAAAGEGPGVSVTLVQPNGAQLQEVCVFVCFV
jgi:sulfite reductase alpha subunit-like flavoprotein